MSCPSQTAGRKYLLLGSLSGTTPGTWVTLGLNVPLNRDSFTNYILAHLGSASFSGFQGTLDSFGMASATLDTLGPIPAGMVGNTAHFSFLNTSPVDFSANAVGILIQP